MSPPSFHDTIKNYTDQVSSLRIPCNSGPAVPVAYFAHGLVDAELNRAAVRAPRSTADIPSQASRTQAATAKLVAAFYRSLGSICIV